MTSLKSLSILAAVAALAAPGAALAVDVEVTFQNQHASQNATYSSALSGGAATYGNASPTPANTVASGGSNVYTVWNPASNLVTAAHVRYTIGSKVCEFHTSYTGTPSGNNIIPNWTKSANSSGGATCTATITYVNASTFNWRVTFTMK